MEKSRKMKPVNFDFENQICSIIESAFRDNPTIRFLLPNNGHFDRALKGFSKYVYHSSIAKHGLYISENDMGLVVLYEHGRSANVPAMIRAYYHLLTSIEIHKLKSIYRHIDYVESQRPANRRYLYCWFFGVHPEEHPRVSAWEIKNTILDTSRRTGLPVYAETTVERNKKIYERFGFETYHYWKNPENNIDVWFMKREPDTELQGL